MDKAQLQTVLYLAGIASEISNITELSGGRQHYTARVDLKGGDCWVIKSLVQKCYLGVYPRQHFENSEQLAQHVHRHLGTSLVALKTANGFTIDLDGQLYLIFPFVVGRIEKELSAGQCQLMGQMLANIHQLPQLALEFHPIPFKRFQLDKWDDFLVNHMSSTEINELKNLAKKSHDARCNYQGRRVISHRDINLENILWSASDQPLLIDWESAGLISPLIELLGMAFNLGGIAENNMDIEKVELTLKAYREIYANFSTITSNGLLQYEQAYASWFNWLEYCFLYSDANLIDLEHELHITLRAIQRMQQYQADIMAFLREPKRG